MTATESYASVPEVTPRSGPALARQTRISNAVRCQIGGGVRLYVAEVRGELWVTDSYWAAPITTGNLAHLWPGTTPEPGVYMTATNGKGAPVERLEGAPPRLDTIVTAELLDEGNVEMRRFEVAGIKVYTTNSDGQASPLYWAVDGTPVGFDPDFLALLCGDSEPAITAPAGSKPMRPAAIWTESSSTSIKEGRKTYRRCVGILMPIRAK